MPYDSNSGGQPPRNNLPSSRSVNSDLDSKSSGSPRADDRFHTPRASARGNTHRGEGSDTEFGTPRLSGRTVDGGSARFFNNNSDTEFVTPRFGGGGQNSVRSIPEDKFEDDNGYYAEAKGGGAYHNSQYAAQAQAKYEEDQRHYAAQQEQVRQQQQWQYTQQQQQQQQQQQYQHQQYQQHQQQQPQYDQYGQAYQQQQYHHHHHQQQPPQYDQYGQPYQQQQYQHQQQQQYQQQQQQHTQNDQYGQPYQQPQQQYAQQQYYAEAKNDYYSQQQQPQQQPQHYQQQQHQEHKVGDYGETSASDVEDIFSYARHNRVEDIENLLDRGVPIDVRDKHGNTILSISCQNGHKRVLKLALRRGADINSTNHRGNSALHFCFKYGFGSTLGAYLIGKGADVSIRNCEGKTFSEGGF